jgi:hypothetical protein
MIEIKKRGLGKITADYTLKDAYKHFCISLVLHETIQGNTIDIQKRHNITCTKYNSICKEFNQLLSDLIIYNAYEFKIPYRIGPIRIRKYKARLKIDPVTNKLQTNTLPVDYKATKLLWSEDEEARLNKKKVYILNTHTDGYRCTWFWSKKRCNIPNKSVYQFIPCRRNKRALAEALKLEEQKPDYFL